MPVTTEDPRVVYAKAHLDMSQAAIARHFGQSRERIRQVFETAKYDHPVPNQRVARESRICGQPDCGRSFMARPKEPLVNCPDHRGLPTRTAPRITITCDECGKTQPRRASLVHSDLTFCNQICHGRWLSQWRSRL